MLTWLRDRVVADEQADDSLLLTAAREHPQQFILIYQRYVRQVYGYCYPQQQRTHHAQWSG